MINFNDGTYLEFRTGSFDNWCVYYGDSRGERAERDTDYLHYLKNLADRYTADKVYYDFVKIYDGTASGDVNDVVLSKITNMSEEYVGGELEARKIFSKLYMAMIAEENKSNTRLGKKIKRLAVHQVLKENESIDVAANYSRGKRYTDILSECDNRGF